MTSVTCNHELMYNELTFTKETDITIYLILLSQKHAEIGIPKFSHFHIVSITCIPLAVPQGEGLGETPSWQERLYIVSKFSEKML